MTLGFLGPPVEAGHGPPKTFLLDIADAWRKWRIWLVLGHQDIYLRYRRSVIGPFWISLSLAAMIGGMGAALQQDLSHRIPGATCIGWRAVCRFGHLLRGC